MSSGKYYCDYCEKQFPDTPAARRRHLQGVVHQRAKALWYDTVRNEAALNQFHDPQAFGKLGVCNHFVRTGSCQYGDSCKYYHPKQNVNTRAAMEGFVNSQSQGTHGNPLHGEASLPGKFVVFYNNRISHVHAETELFHALSPPTISHITYGIMPVMFGNQLGTSLGNLPPSLWPPPEGGYPPLPFIDWG